MKNYYVTVIYRESDDENNMKHVYERTCYTYKEALQVLNGLPRCWQLDNVDIRGATIHLMYKYRDENDKSKGCVELYLLFMEHPSGTKTWKELNDVMTWSYDEIRADKSSLLK